MTAALPLADAPLQRRGSAPGRVLGAALLTLALGAGLLGAAPGVAAAAVTPPLPPLPAGVEDLQPYVGQGGCDPVAKPGVLAFQALLMSTYRDTGSLGIVRDCGIGGTSEHKEGRAFDWAVSVNNPQHVAEVQTVTDWLTSYDPQFANKARRFGIMYMIFNHRIWKAYQPESGWQAYTGPDPHTNHVHFSFGWNGAKRATSWWTGAVAPLDYGPYATSFPPAPTPPGSPGPPAPRPAIDVKHDQLGGDGGWMGPPTGPEQDVLGGRYRPYRVGAIYWSPATGAHEVHGEVQGRYLAAGGSRSVLGLPTTDETPVRGGSASSFQAGQVVWSPTTGAKALYGAVLGEYRATGGPDGLLGLPATEEVDVPGGRAMGFTGGRVSWSPASGAHEVHGGILDTYLALGGESSFLGWPVADEAAAGPVGRGSTFQAGGLYWSSATGVQSVIGAIRAKWIATGGAAGVLGMPTTGEVGELGGSSGTFVGGKIAWSPGAGAHVAYGAILGRWLQDGGAAAYGLPVTDEYATALGTTQDYERASLDWSASTGLVTVRPR